MGKMQMIELDPVKMNHFMQTADARALDLALGKAPGYLVKTKQRCKMPAGVYRLLCKLAELQPDALTPDPEPERTADDPLPGQMEIQPQAFYRLEKEVNTNTVDFSFYGGKDLLLTVRFIQRKDESPVETLLNAAVQVMTAIMEAAK